MAAKQECMGDLGETMPTLRVQLLGGFAVSWDDTPLPGFDTARLQSFCAFLLVNAHNPQPRHYIASVLWQESTESQARTNLRKYIHHLRQKLPEAERFLQIDSQQIQWRPEAAAVVDIHEFERHLVRAYREQKAGQLEMAVEAFTQAIALYKGDLLPACYEDWIALPRERLASRYLQALDQLAQLLAQQNRYGEAIYAVQQLLEQDPLCEASYRRLMQLYLQAGNRSKALEMYQQCVHVLQREMDVEPSLATRQLFEEVTAVSPPAQSWVNTPAASPQASTSAQRTILCADIAGFTTLSEQYDTQALFADINVYMNLLSRLIQAGGGQVIKRMGDALLAMFTHAAEALQLAYEIQRELRVFNAQQQTNGRAPFPTRIGLATGEVLVAHLEMGGIREIEIMGKCVNTAVRLQHVTPINGIALDQLTYTQTKTQLPHQLLESVLTGKTGQERVFVIEEGRERDKGKVRSKK